MNGRRWAAWIAFWIGVAWAVGAALAYPSPSASKLALLVVVAGVVAAVLALSN